MNIRKIIIPIILFTIILSFGNIFVYASNVESTTTEEEKIIETENGEKEKSIFVDNGEEIDDGLPTVSIDDITDWTDKKGFEIIGLLQKFVQPFAIIIFIGCAILTLIGAFGNGHLVSRGTLGMAIALIMYAIVLYAPEIMDVFLNWIRS